MNPSTTSGNGPIALIAPCFNEGAVAARFVAEIDQVLGSSDANWILVMVDDGSTDDTLQQLRNARPKAANIQFVVLELACNVGHQAAILQGLLYAQGTEAERFIVMDSDGEDDPAALLELAGIKDSSIVLVARGRRSENLRFRIGYVLYRWMFRSLTRRSISFGNYTMIDRRILQAVLLRGFVHYAAFLSKQKARIRTITYDRRRRLDGRSKMSLQSLSIHAFRSLIEYSDEVLSLLLRTFFWLAVASLMSIIGILATKFFTQLAIPGWASGLSVSLFNSTLLCLGFFSTGLLLSNTAQRNDMLARPMYTVH